MLLGPVEKMTLAKAAGLPWLTLLVHVGAGMGAILSGFTAIAVAKGGLWHRRAGMVFVYAMIVMGLLGASVALFEGKVGSVIAGTFTAYLVISGFRAVRPVGGRAIDIVTMVAGITFAVLMIWGAVIAWNTPGLAMNGIPDGMKYFIGTVAMLAAIGDLRLVLDGGIEGSRRIARHLWRLCFGLFIAAGSFFLGQMQVMPRSFRIIPLLMVISLAPLVILLYWMWRVRLRRSLRGLTTRAPVAEPA